VPPEPIPPILPVPADPALRGYTPRELGKLLRVSHDQIRAWIRSGELGAVDTARVRCGRPRFVILPEHGEARCGTTPTRATQAKADSSCGLLPRPLKRQRPSCG
jgi:hypothetical protein